MIRNYITIAFRSLLKDKIFSLVNILGLGLSIAACILIVQYAGFQMSFDRFHQRADDVYRVYLDIQKNGGLEAQSARVAPAVASTFQQEFPAIEAYTRMVILGPDGVLTYKDRFSGESDILLADSSFFDVFSFNLVQGNKNTAFDEPFSVVITQKTATAIFGDEDALGKSVVINAKNFDGTSLAFKVTGVIENFPANTHLHPGVLISYPTLFEFVGHQFDESLTWNETYTYFRLVADADPQELESRFPQVVSRHVDNSVDPRTGWTYRLQPVTDIHLHSNLGHEVSPNGKASYVYSLIAVGVLLMLIACFNYVNLMTVKAMQRVKEVGVRKITGAHRGQLIMQFFIESLLVNGIAIFLAITLADAARPMIAQLFGIVFSNSFYSYPPLWIGFTVLLTVFAIGSGLYPAMVHSHYKAMQAFKGRFTHTPGAGVVRKIFVTSQFAIAMILIAVTLAAIAQIGFMQRQSLGFDPEQIVVIRSPKAFDYGYGRNFSGFQNKVSQLAGVSSVSAANVVPGQEIYSYSDRVTVNGKETPGVFSMLPVADNYFAHYNIPLIAGRGFSGNPDDQNNWIVNESAIGLLGFGEPDEAIGQPLNGGRIIGVARDFHHESLKSSIPPILFTAGEVFNYYTVRLQTARISQTLDKLKKAYTGLFPGSPFEFFFLDEYFNNQYKADRVFNQLFGIFSGLAIVVACMGLFGLSSYLTARRSKEIGVRKVMGASVGNMVALLTRDFAILVVIATLLAIPAAYFIIESWLASFAFRMSLTWWMLALPPVMILVLTLATVSVQTIRTALINPGDCLRYE